MKNQLMYLVYGSNETYHREAQFSILSALYRSNLAPDFTVCVYTDQPQHYTTLPVETYTLSRSQLTDWYGELGYFHRAKLLAMQLAATRSEKTCFIDTDTFFLKNPGKLFAALKDNIAIVDELYYAALSQPVAANLAVAQALSALGIDPGNIPVINSGLFGLCARQRNIFEKAIQLNDVVYPASARSNTTEQLVLGMAASTQVDIIEDPQIIKHYWSRKSLFRAKALAFLDQYFANWQSDSAKQAFLLVNEKMPKPPALVRMAAKLILLTAPKKERQFLLESFYGAYSYKNPFDRACQFAWQEKANANLHEKYPEINISQAEQRWAARRLLKSQ